jgi:hypothetical protein
MLVQSIGIGQYATRFVLILQPKTPTEEEKLSCGVAQIVVWADAMALKTREEKNVCKERILNE